MLELWQLDTEGDGVGLCEEQGEAEAEALARAVRDGLMDGDPLLEPDLLGEEEGVKEGKLEAEAVRDAHADGELLCEPDMDGEVLSEVEAEAQAEAVCEEHCVGSAVALVDTVRVRDTLGLCVELAEGLGVRLDVKVCVAHEEGVALLHWLVDGLGEGLSEKAPDGVWHGVLLTLTQALAVALAQLDSVTVTLGDAVGL
jgi:hypothetical protein